MQNEMNNAKSLLVEIDNMLKMEQPDEFKNILDEMRSLCHEIITAEKALDREFKNPFKQLVELLANLKRLGK